MRIRTIEKLSENREFTPEGYLLCKGAALARTGVQRYLAEEVDPELMEGTDSQYRPSWKLRIRVWLIQA